MLWSQVTSATIAVDPTIKLVSYKLHELDLKLRFLRVIAYNICYSTYVLRQFRLSVFVCYTHALYQNG